MKIKKTVEGSFEPYNIIGKCLHFSDKTIKDPTTHIKDSFLITKKMANAAQYYIWYYLDELLYCSCTNSYFEPQTLIQIVNIEIGEGVFVVFV